MNFNYDDNQQMLRDTVDRFLTDRYSLMTRKRLLDDPEGEARLWRDFAELGLLGAAFPQEVGGYASSSADAAVVMERLGRHLVTLPYLVTAILCGRILVSAGRLDLIGEVIAGRARLALAAGSTHVLHSPEDHSFSATRLGDGWVLSGEMPIVIGADTADWLVIAARTSGAIGERHGVTLFLVEAAAASRRAFRMIDAHGAAQVRLDDLRVGPDAVLGEVDGGVPLIELALDHGAAAACSEALGSMSHLVPATVEHTRTRIQYDAPLARFQVLQHRMADMYIHTEMARSMAYVAALALDGEASERRRIVSAAKAQMGKSGKFVGYQAVQLHGGMGVSEELDIGHHHIRLNFLNQMFGDTAFHLRRFAAAGAIA